MDRLPAVMLPAGKPECTVTAIAVCSEVVWEPSCHLWNIEHKDKFVKETAFEQQQISLAWAYKEHSATKSTVMEVSPATLIGQIQC